MTQRSGGAPHSRTSCAVSCLEQFGFDCYWAAARPIPVGVRSGCWHQSYETNRRWSNMVCAQERSSCWATGTVF